MKNKTKGKGKKQTKQIEQSNEVKQIQSEYQAQNSASLRVLFFDVHHKFSLNIFDS